MLFRSIPHVTGEKVSYSLFTTPTCPNCKVAIPMLEEAGIDLDIVNAVAEPDEAVKFGVKQAPTLIVSDGDKFDKYAGIAAIRKFIDGSKR